MLAAVVVVRVKILLVLAGPAELVVVAMVVKPEKVILVQPIQAVVRVVLVMVEINKELLEVQV